MSDRNVAALFALLRFSNGRRIFVLKQVRKLALEIKAAAEASEEEDSAELVARAEEVAACAQEALTFERAARKLERRWRSARGRRSRARGNAAAVDIEIDRIIGAMFTTLEALLVALDPNSEHAAKVRAFIVTYFPEGADAITKSTLEDTLSIVEEMNGDFALLPPEDVKLLNLEFHIRELARLGPMLETELDRPAEGMRFETVRNARLEGHDRLLEVISTIVSQYRGRTPPQLTSRARLLGPIFDANDRVSARRSRKNGPDVEVNPNTGEELEEGEELVEDEEDVNVNVVNPLQGGQDDTEDVTTP